MRAALFCTLSILFKFDFLCGTTRNKHKPLQVELFSHKAIFMFQTSYMIVFSVKQLSYQLAYSTDYTGGELSNGVNGFLTSYATDSVRFSQQILDKEYVGSTNVFIRWQI